ncbi:ubiquitin-like protein [Insectomime virus]|uniref:Ubiquitin-like protein n=1 Tax=Tunisvirus fontaine2 TaxID=1421067 RepID=V9SGM1_9VIRU|nr:ubiquitin-like protein [Tunisvirus fontaine2]AHA45904.1 ubiquitin-like protein [Insectomime virus]AHC55039.1 ubiquitin-like protein [Tunisvirus fontaine2]
MLTDQERTKIQSILARRFPERMAVIFYPFRGESYLSKEKFIIHKDTTFAHTMAEVRKYCPSDKTLTVVSSEKRRPLLMTKTMGELVREHEDNEQILCLLYSEESTFG